MAEAASGFRGLVVNSSEDAIATFSRRFLWRVNIWLLSEYNPVLSRNSNEAIGRCASRLLDDPRRLVSPYTPLQCPHRFSLFSCCS